MKKFLLFVFVLSMGLGFSVKAQGSADCQMPSGDVTVSNVTATSATVSISDLTAVRWEVGYSVADADSPIVIPVKLGVYSYEITGLQPETEYVFSARRVCVDGVSDWMYPAFVTTGCASVSTYPFLDDFEGKEAGFVGQCYEARDFVGPYSTLYSMFLSASSYAHSGNMMFGAGYGSYTTSPASVSGGPVGFAKKFHLSAAMAYEIGIFARIEPSSWNDNSYDVQFVLSPADDPENEVVVGSAFVSSDTYSQKVSYVKVAEDGDYYICVRGYKDGGSSFYPIFDDFSVRELTITPPTGINVVDITSNSAKVEFTKVGALTELYVDTEEDNVLMGRVFTDAAISGSDATISGLDPMTTYYYAMRSVNPGDTSVYSVTGSFTTSCAPATVPFVEDFESETVNQWLGECWKQTVSSGSYRFAALSGDAYNNTEDGSKGIALIYNNSGSSASSCTYDVTFAKNVYLEAGKKYELTIDAKHTTYSYSDYSFRMKFVYGTDGNVKDFAGEEILVSDDTWSNVADYITVPADGEYFVGVKTYYDGSKSYSPNFDNFAIREVTCIPPSGVSISNITATSATVNFTAQGQTTEVFVDDAEGVQVFGDLDATSPLVVSNLDVHAGYVVRLRTINGNDTSAWTADKEFETLCMPVDELPYLDTYENYGVEMLSGCYMIYNSNNYGFKILENSSYNVTDEGDRGLGLVSSATSTSASSSNGMHAVLREFELEAGKNYEVSIYGKLSYSTTATCYVDFVALEAGEAFDFGTYEAFGQEVVDDVNFDKKRGYFTAPANGTYVLGFVTKPTSTSWYPVILDEFGVKEVSCTPANIALNSVSDTAAIVDFDMNGNYEVSLTDAFGTDYSVETINGQYTVAGLRPNRDYMFSARMICAVGDTSDWAKPIYFSTPCSANEVPVFDDFSSFADADALADACYIPVKVNTTSTYMGVYNGEATMISSYQSTPDMANGQNGFTDYVHFEAGQTYGISIDATNNQGSFDIVMSVSRDNDINSANLVGSFTEAHTGTTQNHSFVFTSTATENLYVHIYATSTSWYKVAFDNYRIDPLVKYVYNDSICYGENYSNHGFNLTQKDIEVGENVFTNYLPATEGADTLVELNLYEFAEAVGVVYDYACEGYLYTGYGLVDVELANDTVVEYYTQTPFGCDSTAFVVIYITPAEYATDDLELTLAEAADRFGISEIGEYVVTDTLKNEVGCDSIVTYNLNVVTALDEVNMLNVKVVPNPVMAGTVTYVYGDIENAEKVEIINNMGQVVSVFRPSTYPIAIDGATMPGLYFVRITTSEGNVVVDKFVVK